MNSKAKGKRGELYVVNKFKDYGYNNAHRTAQFKGNTGQAADIEGIDYIHAEVKFVESLNISKAMLQAKRDNKSDKLECIFHKKNNEGLMVTMEFDDWIILYNSFYSDMKLKESNYEMYKL